MSIRRSERLKKRQIPSHLALLDVSTISSESSDENMADHEKNGTDGGEKRPPKPPANGEPSSSVLNKGGGPPSLTAQPATSPSTRPIVTTSAIVDTLKSMSLQLAQLKASVDSSNKDAANERSARILFERRLATLEAVPPQNIVSTAYQQVPLNASLALSATQQQQEPVLPNQTPQPNNNEMQSFADNASTQDSNSGFGLRKLFDLPNFTGRPEEWPRFLAAYKMSTAAYNYTQLENTFRLQKCLSGAALEEVESLLIYPENVDNVLTALEDRFGRPEILVRSQIRQAKAMASVPESRMELMIPFALRVQNLVAFLDTPKTRDHLINPTLLEELLFKLPVSKREEWALHSIENDHPTLSDFSKWLKRSASILSRVTLSVSPRQQQTGASTSRTRPHIQNSAQHMTTKRGNFVLLAEGETPSTSMYNCLCCDVSSTHKLADCSSFQNLSVNSRWDFVRSKRLCFVCLNSGHGTSKCWRRKRCVIDNCEEFHHALLHVPVQQDSSSQRSRSIDSSQGAVRKNPFTRNSNDKQRRMLTCRTHTMEPQLLFRIIPVKLYGPRSVVATYALLDEGSSVTLIDDDLANELQLSGPSRILSLQWFGERSTTEPSRSVDLEISGTSGLQYELRNVKTVRQLNLPYQTINLDDLQLRYRALKNLPIVEFNRVSPRLLIGLDHAHLGIAKQTVECANGPIAAFTKLGWVVYGTDGIDTNTSSAVVLQCRQTDDELSDIHEVVREYYSTENFGVMKPEHPLLSKAEQRARQILASTTVRVGQRYETGLLWANDNVNLPSSRAMALRRLEGIERKMQRDPEFAREYIRIINDYIQVGYARKLDESEVAMTNKRTWYLPHFAVRNPNKPAKLRLVFDAAAKVGSVSLNSHLLTGPDLNQPLSVVLYQFRLGAVGVCGDIKQMFSQIRIRSEDRQSQRFLWRNGNINQRVDTYVMVAMTFGAACSPCSAQYVKNKNAEENGGCDTEAIRAIQQHHYVDDFVASYADAATAARVTNAVVGIHLAGGFELRNLMSNNKDVQRSFGDKACKSVDAVDLRMESEQTQKILGMCWNTDKDTFLFRLQFTRVDPAVMSNERPPTKREALSITMSVFDPFGMLANYTIYAKVFLQNLWTLGLGWDERIPEAHHVRWTKWFEGLKSCSEVSIPRCYSIHFADSPNIELHVFADASEVAFAAVAFWRVRIPGPIEKYDVAFVSGKSRCAPQKILSIPRLELQAAVLASRIYSSIIAAHDIRIDSAHFWTDSQTVIQWIRSNHRRYKPFVAHRVAEILDVTKQDDWHWIPTLENVADDATRTRYPPTYDPNGRWIKGPTFLCNLFEDFEINRSDLHDETTEEEIRPKFVNLIDEDTHRNVLTISLSRFSDYRRLKRTVAWVIRFKDILIARLKHQTVPCGELNVADLEKAELELCRIAQSESFAREIACLRRGNSVPTSSPIHQLSPVMDVDGVVRMGGRTDASQFLSSSAKRPILLPKSHQLTNLIVAFHHQTSKHQNIGTIICSIRKNFWIPHVRSIVKRAKDGCMLCRFRSAKPAVPIMGQLPADRLTPFVRPFTFTGLDYFGPFIVTVGRRNEKRWVALFTCLTIRAVHLELAADLSTDACILCIRNFMNIRGVPRRIRSDNGTNFVGASKEMLNAADSLDQEALKAELGGHGVQWLFNSPSHPEAGGCWERMVQSVKKVLALTLKETKPRVETFRSLLIEAANIINSRPLTYIPVDSVDEEPLTPNHFLLGSTNSTQVPGEISNRALCLRKQWRVAQQLKDRFWKRWIDEVLPELTRRTKWHKDCPPLKKGDLVLICEASLPRGQWKRGRVEDMFPGPDGRVRNVTVQTSDGILRRPASRLAVLDVGESTAW